ncbi:hypothetical protein, partial [Novosphingobium acidiphilum]|uniref:hypothetical protein n=1 Tax=Novosphingobium acidiphilum TaxID=505248 RepID=UPI001B7FBC58
PLRASPSAQPSRLRQIPQTMLWQSPVMKGHEDDGNVSVKRLEDIRQAKPWHLSDRSLERR